MTIKQLTSLNQGEQGKIVELKAGWNFKKRMTELGFGKCSEIKVIKKCTSGPLIIELRGCGRIAIGQGEANKIMVKTGD